MPRLGPVCRRPWDHDGAGRQAACHQRCMDGRQSRSPAGICRSWSGRSLRSYVRRVLICGRLAGVVVGPNGAAVRGPVVTWKDRRHGPRHPRRWVASWSPEQIACRLRLDVPDDGAVWISHEAIYQAPYVQGRRALHRELTACLRTGRVLRVPQARSRGRGKAHVGPGVLISERPAEAGDRAVPGHWEGGLILGLGSSAIGAPMERTTRLTMSLHLPRTPDHGGPRVKNAPALAGHGAEAVRDAIARTTTKLPELLRQSLTWDQGTEMAQHPQLTIDTGLSVYSYDPHSPWQRGTNENANGLLRQYFPKGTDLACTVRTSWLPWPWRSTRGPERRLAGEHLPRCFTRRSERFSLLLRRPIELKRLPCSLWWITPLGRR